MPPIQPGRHKGLCLLSLDAGGPRALSQLKILVNVMHRLNFGAREEDLVRPCTVFDMVCGVGSGGFITIMLAVLGLTAEAALAEFSELCSEVLELQDVDVVVRTQALQHYVGALLHKYGLSRNSRLLDASNLHNGCKIVIPLSYKHQIPSICTLRNFEVREEKTVNLTIFDALLATLATPSLFSPVSVFMVEDVATFEYMSGELVLGNPARELIVEAHRVFGPEEGVACLLSLGCGHPGAIAVPEVDSPTNWATIFEMLVTSSEQRARDLAIQMTSLNLYYRLSVTRGLEKAIKYNSSNAGNIFTHTEVYLTDPLVSRSIDTCVDSLKIREVEASLRQMTHSGGHQTTLAPPKPHLARVFVMRRTPWDFIKSAMLGRRESERLRMLAVTGIGGCGKTQLILKFMEVHESQFSSQAFINGSSETQIRADIKRYVRSLGVDHSQISFEECLHLLAQPSSDKPRLILYDNVDDPEINLSPLLPSGKGCAVIITSRNRSLGGLCLDAHLELDVMSMDESIEMLLHKSSGDLLPKELAFEEARTIAHALGCLPIALTQACSYMYETQCTRRVYLERLTKSQQKLMAQPVRHRPEMRNLSTYAAFDASFEKLPLRAQQFIKLLSYFHWSNFPLELITIAANHAFSEYEQMYIEHGEDFLVAKAVLDEMFTHGGEWDATILDDTVISLQNYSLVTVVPGMDTSLMQRHPLVHAWAQSTLTTQDRVNYQSAAIVLLALGARNERTPVAQYLANHVSHFSPLWDQLHINEAEAFGRILNSSGLFEDALQLREKVVMELRNGIDTNSMNIHDSLWSLAHTYSGLGRYVEAEMLQVEVVKMMKDSLGESHPETIRASGNLVPTYRSLGRLNEARILQEEVLQLSREVLGSEHSDTITASNNLAECYRGLGWLVDAESLQIEVLRVRRNLQGERHPDTITASINLAETCRALGKPEQAEVIQKEVLRLRKEVQGDSHPDTIRAYSNLALTYRDLGRLEEAEALLEDVLRLRRQVMGERHPKTTKAMLNLAGTYEKLGKYIPALDMVNSADEIITMTLGQAHPQYRRCTSFKSRLHSIGSSSLNGGFPPDSPNVISDHERASGLFTRMRNRFP